MAYSKLKASYGSLQQPTLQQIASATPPAGPADSLYNPQGSTDPFQGSIYAAPTSLSTPTLNPAALAQAQQQSLIGGLTQPQVTQLTGLSQDQIAQLEQSAGGSETLQGLIHSAQTGQNNSTVIGGEQTANEENSAANAPLIGQIQNAANAQSGLVGGVDAGYGALLTQQGQNAQTANAADNSALAGYGQSLGLGIGVQAGAYNQLAGTYGSMSQLAPTAYTPTAVATTYDPTLASYQGYQAQDANYQTAQAQLSDYQTYQAQQAALYQASLATASSNPGDVAAEQSALSQLTGMAGGSIDVTNGQQSPGALAAQQSALSQMGALTNPQVTAQEQFLYEQQREAQEQQESASRAALMSSYRAKGVGSSAMELGSILQAGQQNSQQRLLGDLGTQATAVQRATTDLQNYGTLASNMNAQGNAIAQGNQGIRAGAATSQGQLASDIRAQGDNMSMFNAGQTNSVNVANAGYANANAQFNAGAVNDASRFNANAYNASSINNSQVVTQNNEFNAGAYNANQIANAGFNNAAAQFDANAYNSNQQFNAGAVNDANRTNANNLTQVSMTVSQQNQLQSQFMDNYRATQQDQAAQRAGSLAGVGMTLGGNIVNAGTDAFNAQTGVAGAEYGRGQDATVLGQQALTGDYNARTAGNNAQISAAGTAIGNNNNTLGNSLAIGGQLVGSNNATNTAITGGLNAAAGTVASQAATDAINNQPTPGPLGLFTIPTKAGQKGSILGVNYTS